MTRSDTSRPSLALLLGGGGAVGISWQVGLLAGLADHDLDVSQCDAVFGTSAGAVVGALLADGADVRIALERLQGLARSMPPAALRRGNDRFLQALQEADLGHQQRDGLLHLGTVASSAETIDLDAYLELFAGYNRPWPAGFHCTAVDADAGSIRVWGPESGVPLQHAVAASCALPGLFPPVPVDGRLHIDGGLISHLNAPVAAGHDAVIALSCHPLTATPTVALTSNEAVAAQELTDLARTSRVTAFAPDLAAIGAAPSSMMDPDTARRALGLGIRQAEAAVPALRDALREHTPDAEGTGPESTRATAGQSS